MLKNRSHKEEAARTFMLQSYLFGVINKWIRGIEPVSIDVTMWKHQRRSEYYLPKQIFIVKKESSFDHIFLFFSFACSSTSFSFRLMTEWKKRKKKQNLFQKKLCTNKKRSRDFPLEFHIINETGEKSAFLLTLCVWLVYLFKMWIRVPKCQLNWNGIGKTERHMG